MPTPNNADRKRENRREKIWPGSHAERWGAYREKGFFCAPRSLPLLLNLLADKNIVGTSNCSRVYIDLLARDLGQGIVEISSAEEHAYFSGYDSSRSARTWRDNIKALEKAGFIRIEPKPNQPIGFILILHPHLAVLKLREKNLIDESWWSAYEKRLEDTGALIPPEEKPADGRRVVRGGGGRKRSVPAEDKTA